MAASLEEVWHPMWASEHLSLMSLQKLSAAPGIMPYRNTSSRTTSRHSSPGHLHIEAGSPAGTGSQKAEGASPPTLCQLGSWLARSRLAGKSGMYASPGRLVAASTGAPPRQCLLILWPRRLPFLLFHLSGLLHASAPRGRRGAGASTLARWGKHGGSGGGGGGSACLWRLRCQFHGGQPQDSEWAGTCSI